MFIRILAVCAVLISSALPSVAQPKTRGEVGKRPINISPQRAEQLVGALSRRAVTALHNNETAALARLAHPKGLRFAPYAQVSKRDLILRRSTVAGLRHSARIYNWGEADGTGDAIRLPWNAFRLRYLTSPSRDLTKGEANFNTFKTHGNLINNLRSAYPGAIFVGYYIPGTTKYDGMDWRGLWLVWRPVGKNWYLCAVTGDQWTI